MILFIFWDRTLILLIILIMLMAELERTDLLIICKQNEIYFFSAVSFYQLKYVVLKTYKMFEMIQKLFNSLVILTEKENILSHQFG